MSGERLASASGAVPTIAWRAVLDSRVRTIGFGYLFAAVAYANVAGYGSAYPTLAGRLQLVHSFGSNKAVLLFYGKPYDLLTAGGYAAWRVGGLLSIFAAMWGLLAAVRAMRTEEDAGRAEIVLACVVSRGGLFAAELLAIGAGALVLWLLALLGFVLAGLPLAGSAYLALAILSVAPVFAGVGALASQLAPTRRLAIGISSGVLAATFLLRVVADTTALEWLRWLTPLGWVEELRPFTGSRPVVLLAPVGAAVLLLATARWFSSRRDIGTGLLTARDSARSRMRLLSSPTALALRDELGLLAAWLVGVGFFALIVGIVSTSVASAGVSAAVKRELHKLGGATIATPAGYIAFSFLFFVLAVSLYCCSQVSAARREEAEGRLETLLSLPVGRVRWLGGRLLLAATAATVIALAGGLLAWTGAAAQNAGVALADMLAAGANCLPAALLFLSVGALAFAAVPRASTGLAYGLVSVAFVWELVGSIVSAPTWTLDLSPFHDVGFVPAQAFDAIGAIAMLVLAVVAAIAAIGLFKRRDLAGA